MRGRRSQILLAAADLGQIQRLRLELRGRCPACKRTMVDTRVSSPKRAVTCVRGKAFDKISFTYGGMRNLAILR